MKFNVICADPAWAFSDTLHRMKATTHRSAVSQYTVMTRSAIAALDVRSLADPQNCVLALWVPSTLLEAGLDVVRSWGFDFKQTAVWVKLKKNARREADPNDMTSVGMGRLFRQSHELVLVGTMGRVYDGLMNRSQRSVMFDLNKGHSTKPELLQDRLELMFPNANRLELFARRQRPGWTCLGNEIDGRDIVHALHDLVIDDRIDRAWFAALPEGVPTDVIIELQPLLSQKEIEDVLLEVSDVLNDGSDRVLTAMGTDLSGRWWFRGKATKAAVLTIIERFSSVQSVHPPYVSSIQSTDTVYDTQHDVQIGGQRIIQVDPDLSGSVPSRR